MATKKYEVQEHPWADLPVGLADVFVPVLSDLVEEIVRRIPQEVPEYSRPLEGEFGASVRRGVEVALSRLLDLPGSDQPAFTQEQRRVYRNLGIGEARSGRSLEALLSAYRLGARITFAVVADAAIKAKLPSEFAVPLGESVFIYIDEISAASVQGYTEEQQRQIGERDRRRQALLHLLLGGHVDEGEAKHLAGRAGWVLPPRAVVVTVPLTHAEGLRIALGDTALADTYGGQAVAILPEPTGSRAHAQLERALFGREAWVGPVREWDRLADSLRAATLAASNGLRRGEHGGAPGWVSDHLCDLVIGSDPAMVDELALQRLAPLTALREGQRERLTETLYAWLRHRGERAPIADELHVHTQTVGYRVGQLRELFGDSLDDPDVRFELELVLRAQQARG